jgi:hypothetical protein
MLLLKSNQLGNEIEVIVAACNDEAEKECEQEMKNEAENVFVD